MKTFGKKIILAILSLAILQSCGGGVSDRSFSANKSTDNNSNLRPDQIEALANAKLQDDLESFGILDFYETAHSQFPTVSFATLEDLMEVKCADSIYDSIVTKYKGYASLLSEIDNLLVNLEDQYSADQGNNKLSSDDLSILNSALDKLSYNKVLVENHSAKCLAVKKTAKGGDSKDGGGKEVPGPIGPPEDS